MNFRNWLLAEMPMNRLDLKGKWEPNAPNYGYTKQDVGILTNPRGVEKIKQAWSNTKQNYEIYFLKSYAGMKQVEIGEVDSGWVKEKLQLDIQPNQSAITVIFTNNFGDQKVPMTAWIIAHRMGHAFGRGRKGQFEDLFRKQVERDFRELAREVFGLETNVQYGMVDSDGEKKLSALAMAVGTMNSARTRNLRNFNEFHYELLAQYLLTGKIKFNPIPRSLITRNRMAWGRPAPEMRYSRVDQDAHDEWNAQLESHADKYEYYLDNILGEFVGKIFVM